MHVEKVMATQFYNAFSLIQNSQLALTLELNVAAINS
jgi:hypothetical protein